MGNADSPSKWFKLGEMLAMIDGEGDSNVRREIKAASVEDADLSFQNLFHKA